MSKFLLNLLVQNFKALPNSKSQFKIWKEILLLFQPEQPNRHDPPFQPSPPARPSHLHSSWALASRSAWPTPAPPSPSRSRPPPSPPPPRARAPVHRHARLPPHPSLLLPKGDVTPSSWQKWTPSMAPFKMHHWPPPPHPLATIKVCPDRASPHTALISTSLALERTPTTRLRPPSCCLIARPLYRSPSSGEPRGKYPMLPSLSLAIAGEHR
jgi:hypothetical protein